MSNLKPLNQLLAALPPDEYQHLASYLNPVFLPVGQVLYELGEVIKQVYFPSEALISLVSVLEDGSTAEIAMVGKDGIVGYPAFLGGQFTHHRAVVQIEGMAMKLDTSVLKNEFKQGSFLQKVLLLYTQALLTQTSQLAACNRHHLVEQRLARWLLLAQDLTLAHEFEFTQSAIASMLGTRRATITAAVNTLQQFGVVRCGRGRISILDRKGLETSACECYYTIRAEFDRLFTLRD